MKKIVVTGGNGFIGGNLINFLHKKKYFVINIDKNKYSKGSYLLKNLNKKYYKFYELDINSKKIFHILKKYKPIAIFNLAAETHVDRSIDAPENFVYSNILGTFNILEQLRKYKKTVNKKIKLIHVSTDEVYGDIKNGARSSEKSPYLPSSPYSASKASSDHLIKSYVRTYSIDAMISNCCNNYGPGQFPEKLIPTLIFNILNNKNLPIYGKGLNSREWIYVLDHCEALIKIMLKGKIGEFYNIGSNKNLNNLQVSNELLKVSKNIIKVDKKVKILFVKDRPGHDKRYALNSNKIKKKLRWFPRTNFGQGIKLTFNWYLKNKTYYKSLSKKDINKRLGSG